MTTAEAGVSKITPGMVSVVVPAYNRASTIGKTIESVLGQTYQHFELIVVDDCSTDNTADLVKRTFDDARVTVMRTKENGGVAKARNHGLSQAKGEFVLFLDSDDELLLHALKRGVEILQRGFGMVIAPYRRDDGSLTSFDRPEGELAFLDLLCENHMRPKKAGLEMMRRDAIGELRFVAKNLDFIFFRRVAKRGKLYFIAEPLALYHDGPSSMTKARRTPNVALSIERAKALADFLDEFGELLLEHRPLMYGFYAYGAAVGLLLAGEVRTSQALAFRAARAQVRPKYVFFCIFSYVPGAHILLRSLFALKLWWRRI